MIKIEKILQENGPMLTGEVKELLLSEGVSEENARQIISRSRKNIKRLNAVKFPRNEKFLFLDEHYKNDIFFTNLLEAFVKRNLVFGDLLSTLNCLSNSVTENKLKVISGSPEVGEKKYSFEEIRKILLSLEILKVKDTEDGKRYHLYVSDHSVSEHRIIDENIIDVLYETVFEMVKSWMKSNSLVSYNTIRQYGKFGNYIWDLTAPTYLIPFRGYTKENINPGFIVCDIIPQYSINEDEIKYFIRKSSAINNIRNMRPYLPILIGLSFKPDAYKVAKKKGILITTFSNFFGKKNEELLNNIISILRYSKHNFLKGDEDKINKILKSIAGMEGKFNNLRGNLFELLVAHIIYKTKNPFIEIGKNIVNKDQEAAEIDLFCIEGNSKILIVECKAYPITNRIDLVKIKKWFERISVIQKWIKSNPNNSNKKIEYEFWTSSDFEENVIEVLEEKKKIVKKYKIEYKNGKDIRELCKEKNITSISKILDEHYLKNTI